MVGVTYYASDIGQKLRFDAKAGRLDKVRALCAGFPDAYFREIDEARGYPEAFVDALTKAGWLAALIPQDYGGSGLGLSITQLRLTVSHVRREVSIEPLAELGLADVGWKIAAGVVHRTRAPDRARRRRR